MSSQLMSRFELNILAKDPSQEFVDKRDKVILIKTTKLNNTRHGDLGLTGTMPQLAEAITHTTRAFNFTPTNPKSLKYNKEYKVYILMSTW